MPVYTDDFNRTDSADIGSNWLNRGTYSIIGNQLAAPTDTTHVTIYNGVASSPDNFSEAVIASPLDNFSMGVVARSDAGPNSYYLFRANGTDWTLFRTQSGTFTSIGGHTAGVVAGDVIRIECEGTTIRGLRNGIVVVEVTDTGITTGLYSGIRSQNGSSLRYDDWSGGDLQEQASPASTGTFFDFFEA